MYGKTRKDRIRNEHFLKHIGVAFINTGYNYKNPFAMVWACPMLVGNKAGKKRFGYGG